MADNRYQMPGWAAIAQAVLFPMAFILVIVQGIIGATAFKFDRPMPGPADLMFVAITGLGIYTIIWFRRLLNERYQYHGIDGLITAAIWWMVIFQFLSLALKMILFLAGGISEIAMIIVQLSFMTLGMVSIGIIDLFIGVRLARLKDNIPDLIKAFAYLSIAAGAMEVSVILSPLALVLVPISSVILAMIFFREKEEVEFV
jgi:hypothetical protein